MRLHVTRKQTAKMIAVVWLLQAAIVQAVASGVWQEIVRNAPWGIRAAPHGAVVDGRFTLCSGRVHLANFYHDCWRSVDGSNWTQLPDAPWAKRGYPEIVAMPNSTLLLFGGEDGVLGSNFANDVWRSDDGAQSWRLVLKHAPWKGRAGHKGVVVGDEVWVLGGGRSTVARQLFNDVWASADYGVTWEQRTAAAEWSPRAGMETAVLGSRVVLMGGDHDVPVFSSAGPNYHDVWSSGDGGRTWQFVANATWSERTGQKCTQMVLGDQAASPSIICVGGAHQNGTTYLQHDVWRSDDGGHHWERISDSAWGCSPEASSCGKDDMLLLERDGQLWTFGGDEETGSGGQQDNSVWRFTP